VTGCMYRISLIDDGNRRDADAKQEELRLMVGFVASSLLHWRRLT